MNNFGKRSSMQPMEGSTCFHVGPCFFLFEGKGGEEFVIFVSLVPNVFPNMFCIKFSKCSQMRSLEVHQVPKLFPKVFPKATQFYPIWFAQSSILMFILLLVNNKVSQLFFHCLFGVGWFFFCGDFLFQKKWRYYERIFPIYIYNLFLFIFVFKYFPKFHKMLGL